MKQVTDKFGRPLRDLRISVTDKCQFRCQYCMPTEIIGDDYVFLPQEHLLSFEEIERLARVYADLVVKKLRITGGKPFRVKDLYKLSDR